MAFEPLPGDTVASPTARPGFPSHPPSAWIVIFFQPPLSVMLKTSVVPSGQWRSFAAACQHPNGHRTRAYQPAGSVLSSRCGTYGALWGVKKMPLGLYTVRMVQESGPLAGQLTGHFELSFKQPRSNAGRAPTLSSGSGKSYGFRARTGAVRNAGAGRAEGCVRILIDRRPVSGHSRSGVHTCFVMSDSCHGTLDAVFSAGVPAAAGPG
jgi:hypothetical protein